MNITPAIMPKRKIVADLDPAAKAKVVRPGTRKVRTMSTHDGVVKAKHLKPGMEVRAWLHGEPKGGVRVVESVERSEDGAMVRVAFATPHPTTDYKAAYRFFVEALFGMPIESYETVPALVAYEEV